MDRILMVMMSIKGNAGSTVIILIGVSLLFGTGELISPERIVAETLSEQVTERLRNRIEARGIPPRIAVGEERIHAFGVPHFYERRIYRPAWSDDDGLLPQAGPLIRVIRAADLEGLNPGDYHLDKIEALEAAVHREQEKKRLPNPEEMADLDLFLTDAFLVYASHLLSGRVHTETVFPRWSAPAGEVDPVQLLQEALEANRVEEALKGLLPSEPEYIKLRQALWKYREIASKGGWAPVSVGPPLRKEDRGERVRALHARLAATGDLNRSEEGSLLFDEGLMEAVQRFQRRHGLHTDGIVGPLTLAALNVPVERRVRQIELNLERRRWLHSYLGERYILVNIAGFELEVVERGQRLMSMRVVVGRPYRRTPVFSAEMTYLVFNPYWHIPSSIAVKDILPLVQKDPLYLARQNIGVFYGWGAEAKEIDPEGIDWSSITAGHFVYRFRQEPGPMNALGRIKFMLPNKFDVYLHDTPAKELFQKPVRGFSSGCIRVEKPLKLAEYLLRDDPKWTRENILDAIEKGGEKTIRLPDPIAVHLLYWTAWFDRDGSLHFRDDIYLRDRPLDEALRKGPPAPIRVGRFTKTGTFRNRGG